MARKKTSSSKADATSAKADESQNIESPDVADAADQPAENDVIDATAEDVTPDDTVAEDPSPELPDDQSASDPASDDEPTPEDEQTAETTQEEAIQDSPVDETPDPEPKSEPTKPAQSPYDAPETSNGFIPMLLGGLVAGGIGFGASYYWNQSASDNASDFQSKVIAQIEQNADAISSLSDTVDALPVAPDLSAITDEQSNQAAAMDSLIDRLAAVETQVSALDQRLTDVEKRPMTEGASDAAVAAYERELKALQDTMAAQRAEIETLAEEARSMEGNAEDVAKATMLRSALTRVQTAIDGGTGFAPALGDLQAGGVEVPAALSDVAEDGVMSLAQLQSAFPDAARSALAVSRQQAAESGEGSGFSAFLKNQLGTRSLEPREGSDPDAVLSRAEAAARDGRLADTLAEIEALPEVGRAELAEWTTNVTRRQAAVSAVEALGQELN